MSISAQLGGDIGHTGLDGAVERVLEDDDGEPFRVHVGGNVGQCGLAGALGRPLDEGERRCSGLGESGSLQFDW